MRELSKFTCDSKDFEKNTYNPSKAFDKALAKAGGPGIYVWKNGADTLRVGKHEKNAHLRALDHMKTSETHGIKKYKNHPKLSLVLYLLKEPDAPKFPLYALEHFLEKSLNPEFRSGKRRPKNEKKKS